MIFRPSYSSTISLAGLRIWYHGSRIKSVQLDKTLYRQQNINCCRNGTVSTHWCEFNPSTGALDLQFALKTFTGKALLTRISSNHHSDSHRGCISNVDNGDNHYGATQLHLVRRPWHQPLGFPTDNQLISGFYAQICHSGHSSVIFHSQRFSSATSKLDCTRQGWSFMYVRHYSSQRSYWVKQLIYQLWPYVVKLPFLLTGLIHLRGRKKYEYS